MTQHGTKLDESSQLRSSPHGGLRTLWRLHYGQHLSLPFSYSGGHSRKHFPINPYFRFCFSGNSIINIHSPLHRITHPAPLSNTPCSQWLSVFELYQLDSERLNPLILQMLPLCQWHQLWQMGCMAHEPKVLTIWYFTGTFFQSLI